MADSSGISRRTMIKGLGVAAWAAPTVVLMRPVAAAAVSPAPANKRTGPPAHSNAGGNGGPPQNLPGRRVQTRTRNGWDR